MLCLGAVIVAALFGVGATASMVLLFLWVVIVNLVLAGGIRELASHLRRLVPFVAIIVLLNGLAVPGVPAVSVSGYRVLSVEGLVAGVFFAIRLAVMFLALAALLRMVAPEALARATALLVRPFSTRAAGAISFHTFLAMSFVPLFGDEFRRIRHAQSFRGGGMRGGFRDRVDGVRLIIIPLLLSAIRRSEQLAMVVELRGLRERLARANTLGRPRAADYAFALATAAVITAAVFVIR